MAEYSDRDFLYSANVVLNADVNLERVLSELKERCGDDAKVGPAWDAVQERFVETKGVIGVYMRECAGLHSLEYALGQVRQRALRMGSLGQRQ